MSEVSGDNQPAGSEAAEKNVVSTTSSEQMEAQPAVDSGEQQR